MHEREARSVIRSIQNKTGLPQTRVKVILSMLKSAGLVKQTRGAAFSLVGEEREPEELAHIAEEYQAKHELDKRKLEQMMLYGQIATCRWKYLVDYFGEEVDWDKCDNCDNYLLPPEARIGNPEQKLV